MFSVTRPAGVSRFSNVSGLDFIADGNRFVSAAGEEGTNGLGGVEVKIGTNAVVTDAAGAFALSGLCAGTYLVKPSRSHFDFEPSRAPLPLGRITRARPSPHSSFIP